MRKFKKAIVAAVAAVSMMMSLVACGGNKEAYEKDAEELVEIQEMGEPEDSDELKDALEDMDVSTKEAKEIKKVLEDMLDIYEELEELAEEAEEVYADGDEDRAEEILERVDEIMEEIEELEEKGEELTEDFIDAARDAGVDEDLLDEIE